MSLCYCLLTTLKIITQLLDIILANVNIKLANYILIHTYTSISLISNIDYLRKLLLPNNAIHADINSVSQFSFIDP